MRTAFCGACGHIYEKGEDVSVGSIEKAHARCPACGAAPPPVMMAFKDLSEAQAHRLALPPDLTVRPRPGEDMNTALQRAFREKPRGERLPRPGESPRAFVERMQREVVEGGDEYSQRELAKRWGLRVGLTMLVVGLLTGGTAFYLTHEWGRAIALGLAGGFVGGWIADRFVQSPFS